MTRIAVAIVTAALLAGCSITPPIEANSAASFWCATNKPLTPTFVQYATFSDQQKRDMDTHNTYGAAHCGWKPNK